MKPIYLCGEPAMTETAQTAGQEEPELMSDAFFNKYKFAIVYEGPDRENGFYDYFTVGNYRSGKPELYVRHPSPAIADLVIRGVMNKLLSGEDVEGIISLDGFLSPEGQNIRFSVKKLANGELYSVVELLQTYCRQFFDKDVNEFYDSSVLHICMPDENNVLPGEAVASDKGMVGLQKIKAKAVH